MAEQKKASMMEPFIEGLLDKVDSKFTLVTLASRRARQINSYFNQLGDGLGTIVPPQVTSTSRKPLTIALEEVAASKIKYTQRVPADETAADAVAAVDTAETAGGDSPTAGPAA